MSKETEENQEDYATQNRLAMYLEMGWSDFLLSPELTERSVSQPGWPDPKKDAVKPDFYIQIAELCSKWSKKTDLSPASTCDIGAATGRLSYELAARFSSLASIVAVEPSVGFSDWARRFLCDSGPLPLIPQLGPIGREILTLARTRPEPISKTSKAKVEVVTATAEDYLAYQKQFDLVTCLNVVDRHPDPAVLSETLSKLVKNSGILICSSPLDFQSKWTHDGEVWADDLNQIFPATKWEDVAEAELYYEFRYYNRVWTRFNCQVVCKKRVGV